MVGPEFFHMGMEYFRRRRQGAGLGIQIIFVHQEANNPSDSNSFVCFSVFLVVSDDMGWCKRNLAASDTFMVGGNSPQVLFVLLLLKLPSPNAMNRLTVVGLKVLLHLTTSPSVVQMLKVPLTNLTSKGGPCHNGPLQRFHHW